MIKYYVDVPNAALPDEAWITLASFDTKEEAVEYVQHYFLADDEGNINLISEIEDDEDEEEDD